MNTNKGILVLGNQGEGKSHSIGHFPELNQKGLTPSETFIINMMGKELPFPTDGYSDFTGESGNVLNVPDALSRTKKSLYSLVMGTIAYVQSKRQDIKQIVLEDAQYYIERKFKEDIDQKGFDKWNVLASEYNNIMEQLISSPRVLGIAFTHYEVYENKPGVKSTRAVTKGKLLERILSIDGKFTCNIYSHVEYDMDGEPEFKFLTKRMDEISARTPYGMFGKDEKLIPNDLGVIVGKFKEYYKM